MKKMTKISSDTLIETLLEEANIKAKNIIREAKALVQGRIEESRKRGKQRVMESIILINKKAQGDSALIKVRDMAKAQSKAKWLVLEKKHKLIESVLKRVKDELINLINTERYVHVLENLIVEGSIIVGARNMEVILGERDSSLPLDFDKISARVREEMGTKTKISKSEKKIDTIGGAIIQTIDRSIEDFYINNPSLRLIAETSTLHKFRKVYKTYIEQQTLPNIDDNFKLHFLEDLLNDFKKIDSLEERLSEFSTRSTRAVNLGNGKIVMNNTFEEMLDNTEIRDKISQILFT
jgi:vacuolar-type H+-ATPase subunit E/Vma4